MQCNIYSETQHLKFLQMLDFTLNQKFKKKKNN